MKCKRKKLESELYINGKLVNENNPASIKKAIRSLSFSYIIVLLGFVLLYYIQIERFLCERSKNTCEFQERNILSFNYKTKRVLKLNTILQAYVDTKYSEDATTYRVVLETTAGNFPLFNSYSSLYDKHVENANKINMYLKSQKAYLKIKGSLLGLLIPFGFILGGLYFAWKEPHRLKKRLRKILKNKNFY